MLCFLCVCSHVPAEDRFCSQALGAVGSGLKNETIHLLFLLVATHRANVVILGVIISPFDIL